MEETITMTEILSRIVRSWKKLWAAALAVAVLLGGFQAYRMVSQAKSPSNSPDAIEARYQAAMESYTLQKEILEKDLAVKEQSLASKQEYAENSLLMAIDPYNVYTTSIIFAFTNISGDGVIQGVSQYQTDASYLVQTIRSQYIKLWETLGFPEELGHSCFAGIETKYLAEVVSVQDLDGGLCAIRVGGSNASETQELAEAIYQYFLDHRAIIAASSYPHELTIVSESTKNRVDDTLIAKHEALSSELKSLEDIIGSLQTQLNGLSEPQRETGFAASTIIKSVLKYVVLGAVLGVVLTCFWICCMCVFGTRISSSYQLERLADLRFLGSLKTSRNVLDRFANHIISERAWTNQEQAGAYLTERVKTLCPSGGQLLVLSTLPPKTAEKAAAALTELLSNRGYTVKTVLDASHCAETVQAVQESNMILLAESVDVSRMSAVQDVATQVREAGKQFIGFVMI